MFSSVDVVFEAWRFKICGDRADVNLETKLDLRSAR